MPEQKPQPWPFPVVNGKHQASPAPALALPPANPYPARTPVQALIEAPDYHFLDEFTEDDAPL